MDLKEIVFICIAIFLPIGAIVANKLLDRTTINKKDAKIDEQRQEIQSLASEKENAQKAQSTAMGASQLVGSLAKDFVNSVKDSAPLMEQAKQVTTEADAIELARKQVEAQR